MDDKIRQLEELCKLLEEKYPEVEIDFEGLRNLYEGGEKQEFYNSLQKMSNWLMENYGYNETLLDFQLYINGFAHENDLVFDDDVVLVENGREFVQ